MLAGMIAGASASSLGTLFVKLTADSTDLLKGVNLAETSIAKSSAAMLKVVAGLALGTGAALAGIGVAAIKLATDFESSFAGVRKTVNATEAEFASFKQSFRDMAKELPINVNEINAVAEAAGQLGIKNENLVSFTRTMVDLGNTTNLSSNEAATQLARLANITQMSQKDFDRLGSTIVALGNNFATTEAEIVAMALRISGAGKVVGLTESQILSMAAGLSSVGIEAEAGGTAMSQAMIKMAKAVAQGGEDLEIFAKTAGMTGQQFAKVFKDDATGAILKFFEGLKKMTDQGGDVFTLLEDMGMDGIRLTDVMLRTAGAGDLFARAIRLGSEAWGENNALSEEARKRYETFASQLTITVNLFKDMLITLGDKLLPIVKVLNTYLQDSTKTVGEFDSSFSGFVNNTAPALLNVLGAIGDVVWGWKLIFKTGEIAFLSLAHDFYEVIRMLSQGVASTMNFIVDGFIAGINEMIKAVNLLLPKAQEMGQIDWKLNAVVDPDTIVRVQALADATKEAREELAKMTGAGSFSDRLQKDYQKVTATVIEENKKITESIKALPPGAGGVTPKKAANFDDLWKGVDMPGQSQTLSMLEDPIVAAVKQFEAEKLLTAERLEFLEEAAQLEIEAGNTLSEEKLKILEAYNERAKALQMAQAQIVLQTSSKMFEDLAGIAATFAGKQSGVYKAMFAMSKAFAIADATVKIAQGIANAASLPWPANLAAMASVIAATASIVSNIQAVKLEFGGERESGGPVSSGKTFLVGEKGPELFTPASNGTIIPNDALSGESGGGVKVVINNYTDARPEVRERNEGGEKVIEVMIRRVKNEISSEIRDGRGDVTRSMEATFGLKRGHQ